ncbi:hypothetical protein JIN80_17680 [Cerasicoccus arenae]|nr:hypothetical protein [Cerasicoccus arenae]
MDDDGNRQYNDQSQQDIWNTWQDVQQSDYYNDQRKNPDTGKMEDSALKQLHENEDVTVQLSFTDGNTSYFSINDNEIRLSRNALDGKETKGIDGKGNKGFMSAASVLIHEGRHAFDFNITAKGNKNNYSDSFQNMFAQPKNQWSGYPSQTEYNAVWEANQYRSTVGESLRSQYNTYSGVAGLADSVDYFVNPRLPNSNGRALTFERHVEQYNSANNPNFSPARAMREDVDHYNSHGL